jgi:IS6 family transposase
VLVSTKRDVAATRRFFIRALDHGRCPSEVTTDRAAAYPRVIEELFPAACHVTERYANNAVEADHGRLKARLRPMRSLKRLCSARVISAGHAFVQNLRRGHYELGLDIDQRPQLTVIFTELARAICSRQHSGKLVSSRLRNKPCTDPHSCRARRSCQPSWRSAGVRGGVCLHSATVRFHSRWEMMISATSFTKQSHCQRRV